MTDREQTFDEPDFEDADGPGYFDDDCTWCSGEGQFWGNELPGYDPGWHLPDELYPCPACRGSGSRRKQVLF